MAFCYVHLNFIPLKCIMCMLTYYSCLHYCCCFSHSENVAEAAQMFQGGEMKEKVRTEYRSLIQK